MLYTGSTCALTVKVSGDRVRLGAADSYKRKHAAMLDGGLLGTALFTPDKGSAGTRVTWHVDSPELPAAVRSYLQHLVVDSRWTDREADVQMRWAQIAGPTPWTYLDREAVLGYAAGESPPQAPLQEAWDQLRARERGPWPASTASVREGGWQASELDQIAIDPQGDLVLIELKFCLAPAAFIYGAPLQLLEYVCAWNDALAKGPVLHQLQQLIDAKAELGLLPRGLPPLSGRLRSVVAFGAWLRPGAELHRKFWATVRVANRFLPACVPPIEVWSLEEDGVPRLAAPEPA